MLLRWQEFATRSAAVFFLTCRHWRCWWQISIRVKARVVNWKQVDAAAFEIVLVVLQWANCSMHVMVGVH